MKKSKYVKNGETFIIDRERMKELEKPDYRRREWPGIWGETEAQILQREWDDFLDNGPYKEDDKSKDSKLSSDPVFPGTPAKVEPRSKGKLYHSKTRRRKSVVS